MKASPPGGVTPDEWARHVREERKLLRKINSEPSVRAFAAVLRMQSRAGFEAAVPRKALKKGKIKRLSPAGNAVEIYQRPLRDKRGRGRPSAWRSPVTNQTKFTAAVVEAFARCRVREAFQKGRLPHIGAEKRRITSWRVGVKKVVEDAKFYFYGRHIASWRGKIPDKRTMGKLVAQVRKCLKSEYRKAPKNDSTIRKALNSEGFSAPIRQG